MISISEAITKMISGCDGNQYDICHFLKVWSYAKVIGELEQLDERTQKTLEYASIVHDIACPSLRITHGSAPGDLQEQYGPALAQAFYQDAGLDPEMLDRICYLVGHHHTFTNVDGLDHQILLEADFLVNAGEQGYDQNAIEQFRKNVYRTKAGTQLLDMMYKS